MIAAQLSAEHQSGYVVEYELSGDDVRSAWKTVQRSTIAYLLGPALVMTAISLLIPALFVSGLVFLGFVGLLYWVNPRNVRGVFLKAKGLQPDESLRVRLNLTSNALLSEDKAIITQQAWHRFDKFLESDDWFIILTGKAELISIPRSQVNPEDVDQVRQHLVAAEVKQRTGISWVKLALISAGLPLLFVAPVLLLGGLIQADTEGDLNRLARFCEPDEIGVVTETADGSFSFYCS